MLDSSPANVLILFARVDLNPIIHIWICRALFSTFCTCCSSFEFTSTWFYQKLKFGRWCNTHYQNGTECSHASTDNETNIDVRCSCEQWSRSFKRCSSAQKCFLFSKDFSTALRNVLRNVLKKRFNSNFGRLRFTFSLNFARKNGDNILRKIERQKWSALQRT